MVNASVKRPRIGISACLLGQKVRWDGQHKRDAWITEVLAEHVDFVPVCPELEMGLGVPREPIHLVGRADAPRLVAVTSGADLTSQMNRFAATRIRQLADLDLAGYVLKKDSPSCGMERVRVFPETRPGPPRRVGVGLFARALLRESPMLPVEEEARLHDPEVRDGFVERIFAFCRWKHALSAGVSRGTLVRFHTAHKLALLAHSPSAYRRLGALVGGLGRSNARAIAKAYGTTLMAALRVPATRGKHQNVLEHVMGHFKGALRTEERRELEALVRNYARGRLPRIVPLVLMRHHAKRLEIAWLLEQTYLNPDPPELMLRAGA